MKIAQVAPLGLLVSYSVAVHYGVLSLNFFPALIALSALLALLAGQTKAGFRPLRALAAAGAVLVLAGFMPSAQSLFLAPPLLIYFGMAGLFAMSLLPDRIPLVTRIARLLDGEPDRETRDYTRTITLAWALFLAALGGVSLLLACCAEPRMWSLFTNVLGYLLILGFFVLEFGLRRRCLPQLPRRSFAQFMLAMLKLDPASWRR